MQNLWQKYGGSIQFVAVRVFGTGLQTFIADKGITFPVLDNPSVLPLYWQGSYTLPLVFIIGADKIVRKIFSQGPILDQSALEGHILDVLHTRAAVDLEMVMDVSDTMNSPAPNDPAGDPKLALMKQAAKMIVDHLSTNGQADDQMGLVWFTDNASEYVHPLSGAKLLSVTTYVSDLKGAIDAQGSGICTAMGAGLQMAFNTLSGSTHKKFVILCTDGMQNVQPKVEATGGHYEIIDTGGGWECTSHASTGPANVPGHPGVNINTYGTGVHTIGIGITANYEPTLQGIADQTGGFYRATNDPRTTSTWFTL
jgi:hypothetical protein